MRVRPKVVAIDDDAVTLKIVSAILKDQGMRVHVAQDADIGFKLAQNETPDVIILDFFMPGKDGLSVLCDLRRNSTTSRIPVLMLTNDASYQTAEQAFALGADGYLVKPFTPDLLHEKILKLLQQREKDI